MMPLNKYEMDGNSGDIYVLSRRVCSVHCVRRGKQIATGFIFYVVRNGPLVIFSDYFDQITLRDF